LSFAILVSVKAAGKRGKNADYCLQEEEARNAENNPTQEISLQFPHGMRLTLSQLCQNYLYPCVRIGKIDRLSMMVTHHRASNSRLQPPAFCAAAEPPTRSAAT
jgi:hypothetical protein